MAPEAHVVIRVDTPTAVFIRVKSLSALPAYMLKINLSFGRKTLYGVSPFGIAT